LSFIATGVSWISTAARVQMYKELHDYSGHVERGRVISRMTCSHMGLCVTDRIACIPHACCQGLCKHIMMIPQLGLLRPTCQCMVTLLHSRCRTVTCTDMYRTWAYDDATPALKDGLWLCTCCPRMQKQGPAHNPIAVRSKEHSHTTPAKEACKRPQTKPPLVTCWQPVRCTCQVALPVSLAEVHERFSPISLLTACEVHLAQT
jgi:hypothetical protein